AQGNQNHQCEGQAQEAKERQKDPHYHYATLAKTSETLTERADQAGNKLPTRPVAAPIANPQAIAPSGIRNAGKKPICKGMPPMAQLMSAKGRRAPNKPLTAPTSSASPNTSTKI